MQIKPDCSAARIAAKEQMVKWERKSRLVAVKALRAAFLDAMPISDAIKLVDEILFAACDDYVLNALGEVKHKSKLGKDEQVPFDVGVPTINIGVNHKPVAPVPPKLVKQQTHSPSSVLVKVNQ